MVLPKPQPEDLAELRIGQVLWGWPHCVQDDKVTQLAIDRQLTLIAFEAMNHWTTDGRFNLHVFHKNNELAGYCSVLHALELIGSTGDYGRRLRAVVIGFGATARGAVTALNAHGVHDVDVLTGRGVTAVGAPIHSARIIQFDHDDPEDDDPRRSHALTDEGRVPLAGFLAEHDIIVNCVLQDPDAPLTFLIEEDLAHLAPGSLIVDVSCDHGMGFSWARPTGVRRPDVRGRRQRHVLRRRPQPVVPVELGDLGDQRGPAARSSARCSKASPAGTPTPPSAARSRSRPASSAILAFSPSSAAPPTIPTRGCDPPRPGEPPVARSRTRIGLIRLTDVSGRPHERPPG